MVEPSQNLEAPDAPTKPTPASTQAQRSANPDQPSTATRTEVARGATGLVAMLLLGGAIALCLALFVVNRRFYHDDAMISLRYCRNFLDGRGLVWNPGEFVEGYSNFTEVLLVSGLAFLGMDLVVATRVVGIAGFLGILSLLAWHTASERRSQPARSLTPLLVALSSCTLVVWSLGGLEVTMCTAFALAGVVLMMRELTVERPASASAPAHASGRSTLRVALAGVSFALAAMTRFDCGFFMAAAFTCLFLFETGAERFRRTAILVAAFAVLYVPFFAWRYHYYGDFFPNTFYAKNASEGLRTYVAGVRYVVSALLHPPCLGLWLAAALFGVWKKRSWSRPFIYLLITAAAYLVFPIYAGGDHMPAARFIAPLVPVFALILYEAFRTARWAETPREAGLMGAALLFVATFQFRSDVLCPAHESPAAYIGTITGEYMEKTWPAGSLVTISAAGAAPYHAMDLRFVDMLGLTDRHIAHRPAPQSNVPYAHTPGHRKGDGAYILSREPDFLILGPPEGTTPDKPLFVSDDEIAQRRAELDRSYTQESVDIDVHDRPDHESFESSATGKVHFIYFRRTAPHTIR